MLSPNFPLNLSPKTWESCMSYPKCRKCMHQMNELCDEHSLHLPQRWSRLVISGTCKTPRFPHIPTSSSSEPVASQCIALASSKQVAMMGLQIFQRLFIGETRKMMSSLWKWIQQAHFFSTQGSETQRFLWQVLRAALVPAPREKASVDLCRGVV